MVKLTLQQEAAVAGSYREGTTATELRIRYHCTKHVISDILKRAGLTKPFVAWPDEHIEFLKSSMMDHSSSQVADLLNKKFGTNYSRGSVAGKLSRLGLSKQMKKGAPVKPKPHPKRTTPFLPSAPLAPVESKLDNSDSLNMTLMDLDRGMCHWPTGDGYCGHVTSGPRVSYCDKHQKAGTEPGRYRGIWASPIRASR